jgi:two-component system, cell cycle sensor histidine kinase and response regulator CckA
LKVGQERFTISLSIHPGSEKTVSSLDYKRGSETILMVEDEALLCQVIVEMLGHLGYNVLGAASGKEALAIAKEYAGRIDVLITDVLMPGLAGPQLADSLRGSRPGLKVIFVSGDAEAKHVLGLGDALLQKPFSLKMLSCKVREVLQL